MTKIQTSREIRTRSVRISVAVLSVLVRNSLPPFSFFLATSESSGNPCFQTVREEFCYGPLPFRIPQLIKYSGVPFEFPIFTTVTVPANSFHPPGGPAAIDRRRLASPGGHACFFKKNSIFFFFFRFSVVI